MHESELTLKKKLLLLLGDLISLSIFIVVGVIHHGGDPVRDPVGISLTLIPFIVGWLLASLPLNIYNIQPDRNLKDIAIHTGSTWILAAAIGLAMRSTGYLPGDSPPVFIAVVIVFGGIFVIGWRVILYSILYLVE